MKFDKELDIKSLVRESFRDAMKQNGMLKEQKDSEKKKYVKRPFNKETDMPKVEMRAGEWKDPQKPSAQSLDVVLSDLIIEGSTATDTYKRTIKNISQILGMEVAGDGSVIRKPSKPPGSADTLNNVKQLLSSLQVKDIMHSIIFYQEAQAAGKMFEGLIARILGGTAVFDEMNPIQDIISKNNEYISLKLLNPNTSEFKGSKFNLAKGLTEADKVTYLILMKSAEQNPFSVRAYSFDVTRDNYFSLITGRFQSELSDKFIYSVASKIVKPELLEATFLVDAELEADSDYMKHLRGEVEKVPAIKKRHEKYESTFGQLNNEDIDRAVIQYARENDQNFELLMSQLRAKEDARKKEPKSIKTDYQLARSIGREKLREYISSALEEISKKYEKDIGQTQEDEAAVQLFFKSYFKTLDPNSDTYVLNMFPSSTEGAKSFMTDYPDNLSHELQKLYGLSDIERFALLEPDQNKKRVLTKRANFLSKTGDAEEEQKDLSKDEIKLLNSLTDSQAKDRYDKIFKLLNSKIVSLNTILNDIKKYALKGSERESEIVAAKKDASKTVPAESQKSIIKSFFNVIQKEKGNAKLESDKKKGIQVETQFNISPNAALEIAKKTNSNYDEDYPVFYIQKEWIMMSSQENIKLLDEVLVPFFSGVHDIKSGLEQYFTYDEVDGLEETSKGIDSTGEALKSHVQRFQGLRASEINPQSVDKAANKQNQLQENKKSLLTNPKLSAILEELLEK